MKTRIAVVATAVATALPLSLSAFAQNTDLPERFYKQ